MRWTDVLVAACFLHLHLAASHSNQQLPSPRLEEEPKNVLAKRGSNVTFKCRCTNGYVQWFRNGKVLQLRREYGYEMLEIGDLLIMNVNENHQGKYYCKVSVRHVGAVRSRTAELKIRYIKTKLLIPPSNLSVYEGNSAYFYCLPNTTYRRRQLTIVMPNSTSQVSCVSQRGTWIRDGCPLRDSEQFRFLSDGSLLVSNVSTSKKEYKFCCTVTPTSGTGVGPECAYLTAKESSGVMKAPYISVTPRDITVQAGSDIVLPCIATGVPTPNVKWYKPNNKGVHTKKLETRRRVNVIEPGVLNITKSKPSDSGVYRCKAKNKFGQKAEAHTTVIVSDIPRVSSTFNTIWIWQSETAVLHCPFIAQNNHFTPSFNITWLVNGTTIQNTLNSRGNKFFLSHDKLTITGVGFSDEGMYQCLLENAYGSAQATFRLRTAGTPDRVQNFHFDNVPGDVVLSWSPGYPSCQTSDCLIKKHEINVTSMTGRKLGSYIISGNQTSVLLMSKGIVQSSGEYQISVRACHVQFNKVKCGKPYSQSRYFVVSDSITFKPPDIFTTAVVISYSLDIPLSLSMSSFFHKDYCTVCVHYTDFLSSSQFNEWQVKCQKCRIEFPQTERKVVEKVEISGLKPWTEYQFFSRVYGRGTSNEEAVATSHIERCRTAMAKPSRAPLLQQAIRVNSTTFKLIFQGINSSDVRSQSFYYQLNGIEQNQTTVVHQLPVQNRSDADNKIISVLINHGIWYNYKLTVQSCCYLSECMEWATKTGGIFVTQKLEQLCKMSCSEHSASVVIKPSEIKFEAVTNITVHVSALSAKISWEPINSSLVWGYKVNVSMGEDDLNISYDITASQLNVTGLRQQTHYKVTVSVWTFDRLTPIKDSRPVEFVTSPEMLAPPNHLTVKRGNRMNSVVVSWELSLHSNVTGYIVSSCNSSQQFPFLEANATTSSSIFRDLQPNKRYLIKVATLYNGEQGAWSSYVSYRTPDFIPPPQISNICIGLHNVQLTVHPCSHLPATCQFHSLNVSVCQSGESTCYAYDTTFEAENQSGDTITLSVEGLKILRGYNYSISLQYANYEGAIPAVWSDSVLVSDSCSGLQHENTEDWILVVGLILGSMGIVGVSLCICLVCQHKNRTCKHSRTANRHPKISTASSVGPGTNNQVGLYTEPDLTDYDQGDNDSQEYTSLDEHEYAEEDQNSSQDDKNRVHNQADDFSSEHTHIPGLYLGQPPQERPAAKKGRRWFRGRQNRHKQDTEEGNENVDIPLSLLHQQHSVSVVEYDSNVSQGTGSRRIGVIVHPEINHILPPPPSSHNQENPDSHTTIDKIGLSPKEYMQLEDLVTPLGNYKQPEDQHESNQENTDENSLKQQSQQVRVYHESHDHLSDTTDTSSLHSQPVDCTDDNQLSQNQVAESKKFKEIPRPQTKTLHSNCGSRYSIRSLADDGQISFNSLIQHEEDYSNPTGTYVSRNSIGAPSEDMGISSYSPPLQGKFSTNTPGDYVARKSVGALSEDMGISSYSPPQHHKSQTEIIGDYSSGSSFEGISIDMDKSSYSRPQHQSKHTTTTTTTTTTTGDYVSRCSVGELSEDMGIASYSPPQRHKSLTDITFNDRLSVDRGISSHSPPQHYSIPYITATGDHVSRHSSGELSDDMGIALYSPHQHHKSHTDITQTHVSESSTETPSTSSEYKYTSSQNPFHLKPHVTTAGDYVSRTVAQLPEDTKENTSYSPL